MLCGNCKEMDLSTSELLALVDELLERKKTDDSIYSCLKLKRDKIEKEICRKEE